MCNVSFNTQLGASPTAHIHLVNKLKFERVQLVPYHNCLRVMCAAMEPSLEGLNPFHLVSLKAPVLCPGAMLSS